jgi:hypothetical protein
LPEPGHGHDPKLAGELAVVLMLRRAGTALSPDDATRDRMRAAVLQGLAEQPTEPQPVAPTPKRATSDRPPQATGPGRRVTGTRGRLTIALGAAFCLVVALSGMTLLLSRHALPGDALYGVRRTVESASLGLTSGDDAKGRKYLEFAADRIGDIESLGARYPDRADSPVGDYLTAFTDFGADARAGTADLTAYATNHGDGVLTTLRTWAPQQADRIRQVEPVLPTAAARQATATITLLNRIVARATAIAARNDCYTITSGGSDDLGVLPATGPCDKAPGTQESVGGAAATRLTQPPVPTTRPAEAGTGTARRAPVAPRDTTEFATPPLVAPPVEPVAPTGVLPTTVPGAPGTVHVPLPLPGIQVPPLLPGLPGLRIGR